MPTERASHRATLGGAFDDLPRRGARLGFALGFAVLSLPLLAVLLVLVALAR